MKIEIDVEIPEGYEATGELRTASYEPAIYNGKFIKECLTVDAHCIILRKIVKRKPMIACDLAMLPSGAAFIFKDHHDLFCKFSPVIDLLNDGRIMVGGWNLECFKGYNLPTDSADTIRLFEVEE